MVNARLAGRHDGAVANLDVLGARSSKDDKVGCRLNREQLREVLPRSTESEAKPTDVLAPQRREALVPLVLGPFISTEPDRDKVRLGHSRRNLGDPHIGVEQLQLQALGQRVDKELGTAVNTASRVDIAARDAANVDDVTLVAFAHTGDHGLRDENETLDVGVDDGVDHLFADVFYEVDANAQACVVDKDRNVLELGRQGSKGSLDGRF